MEPIKTPTTLCITDSSTELSIFLEYVNTVYGDDKISHHHIRHKEPGKSYYTKLEFWMIDRNLFSSVILPVVFDPMSSLYLLPEAYDTVKMSSVADVLVDSRSISTTKYFLLNDDVDDICAISIDGESKAFMTFEDMDAHMFDGTLSEYIKEMKAQSHIRTNIKFNRKYMGIMFDKTEPGIRDILQEVLPSIEVYSRRIFGDSCTRVPLCTDILHGDYVKNIHTTMMTPVTPEGKLLYDKNMVCAVFPVMQFPLFISKLYAKRLHSKHDLDPELKQALSDITQNNIWFKVDHSVNNKSCYFVPSGEPSNLETALGDDFNTYDDKLYILSNIKDIN